MPKISLDMPKEILDDLKNLSTNGAVIGKALYDGAFTLRNALDVTSC